MLWFQFYNKIRKRKSLVNQLVWIKGIKPKKHSWMWLLLCARARTHARTGRDRACVLSLRSDVWDFMLMLQWHNEKHQCECAGSPVAAPDVLWAVLTSATRTGGSSSQAGAGSQDWTRTSARSPSTLTLSVRPCCSLSVTSSTHSAARWDEKHKWKLNLKSGFCLRQR